MKLFLSYPSGQPAGRAADARAGGRGRWGLHRSQWAKGRRILPPALARVDSRRRCHGLPRDARFGATWELCAGRTEHRAAICRV